MESKQKTDLSEKPDSKEDLFWTLLQEKEQYNEVIKEVAATYLASERFVQLDFNDRDDMIRRLINLYDAFK